ncbi:MAG: ATP-binding protein, partial [Calditrichota bacterium]
VLECDESLCIRTDAVLFEEIILNLLHNAFKYSLPEKNIQILCKQSNTDSTKEAIIKIKDEAGGIPEDILKEASQAFSPGKSTRDLKEGFHLGLYIIHEFTKILNGEIIFNPVNNTGTEAILSFKENLT